MPIFLGAAKGQFFTNSQDGLCTSKYLCIDGFGSTQSPPEKKSAVEGFLGKGCYSIPMVGSTAG